MRLIFWNCLGLGQTSKVCTLRDFCKPHKPLIVFISEVKLSCQVKVNNIVSSLGFDKFWLVPSMGSASGILLMWKSHINVQIITSSDMYIYAMVVRDPLDTPWMLTGVYGPSNPHLKSIF